MKKISIPLKPIVAILLVLSCMSFHVNHEAIREVNPKDVSKVIVSEWFPHEFNLNPTSSSSFKISFDSSKTLNDHTILVFGRNILGTSALPYANTKQEYTYQLIQNHIEFQAKDIGNSSHVPFDFFSEFRYMMVPNIEIATMIVAIDRMNYKEVMEYFNLKEELKNR